MGLSPSLRRSSVRLSLGHWIDVKDLDGIVQRFSAGLDEACGS
jgi:cysteine sulfinate desulfinase/cysteine desulfurase-like protein